MFNETRWKENSCSCCSCSTSFLALHNFSRFSGISEICINRKNLIFLFFLPDIEYWSPRPVLYSMNYNLSLKLFWTALTRHFKVPVTESIGIITNRNICFMNINWPSDFVIRFCFQNIRTRIYHQKVLLQCKKSAASRLNIKYLIPFNFGPLLFFLNTFLSCTSFPSLFKNNSSFVFMLKMIEYPQRKTRHLHWKLYNTIPLYYIIQFLCTI